MVIIGFGHRSRVGKDTAGSFLETSLRLERPKLKIKRVGFADKLKVVASDLFGVQGKVYYENNPGKRFEIIEKFGHDIVELWVKVGNKMREIYADIWIDFVLNLEADVLIITDVRFPNEVAKIQDRGGRVYKIVNDRARIRDTVSDAALDAYTGWDGTFLNNGSIDRLMGLMDSLASHVIRENFLA